VKTQISDDHADEERQERHDRQRVEAGDLHHVHDGDPADAAGFSEHTQQHHQRLAEEADGLDDLLADVGDDAADRIEKANPALWALGFGCGLRGGFAGGGEQAQRLIVLAAHGDAFVLAGGAFADCAVDDVGAGDIDAAQIAHVNDGARAEALGDVSQSRFETGDGVHRPVAAQRPNRRAPLLAEVESGLSGHSFPKSLSAFCLKR
jgi:hypothetical protein